MMTRRIMLALGLLAGAVLTGCATSRSEIKLGSPVAAPTAPTATAVTAGRAVLIRSVKDERVFEEAPADPSTPSLGLGGATKASDEVKARAVARKRGSFGAAMGDVLLDPGQTVAGLVREHLASAFQQAGYRVVGEGSAEAPAALLVDVRVKKFWAWFQPGFWAITLSANIETDLELVSRNAAPTHVSVRVDDSRQMATDGAWMEVIDKALAAYRAQAGSKLSGPPF